MESHTLKRSVWVSTFISTRWISIVIYQLAFISLSIYLSVYLSIHLSTIYLGKTCRKAWTTFTLFPLYIFGKQAEHSRNTPVVLMSVCILWVCFWQYFHLYWQKYIHIFLIYWEKYNHTLTFYTHIFICTDHCTSPTLYVLTNLHLKKMDIYPVSSVYIYLSI